MSYVALGLGVGGLVLGAGTGIYGASQQPDGISAHQLPFTGYNPWADPLLSGLTMNAGAGIGMYDPNVYRQASPVQQLLAQAGAAGTLSRRQYRQIQSSLNYDPDTIRSGIPLWRAVRPDDGDFSAVGFVADRGGPPHRPDNSTGWQGTGGGPKIQAWREYLAANNMTEKQFLDAKRGLETADRLARSAGYADLNALFEENQAYLARGEEMEAQYAPVAERMRTGLLSSQDRLAGYLQNLPDLLTGGANPFTDRLREDAMIAAQRTGANPHQFLEQARSTALQRALQLVQGEQVAQAGQQQAALPIAQLRQQGGATAANVGAGQAAMLAQALASQQAAQAQQAQAWGSLGNSLAGYGLIGADMYGNRGPGAGQRPGGGGGWDTGAA